MKRVIYFLMAMSLVVLPSCGPKNLDTDTPEPPENKTKASGSNILVGTLAETIINSDGNFKRYVLQKSGDECKFLRVTSQIKVPANRCYLEIPNNMEIDNIYSQQDLCLSISDDEEADPNSTVL